MAKTTPLIYFPPSLRTSKTRSDHAGGKYGEPTISKGVVYERLEPFELLNKSDPRPGPNK